MSAKKYYQKPSLTFSQQISHLENRGMQFSDKIQAERQLASISYYRLSGYWHPFRVYDAQNNITDRFEKNSSFSNALFLYEFDRQLRSLVLDGIERIEVAIRTQFTYHIGHRYGPFGHVNAANFHPSFNHKQWLNRLEEETKRSSDQFIKHYQKNYLDFPTIPIWMLTEVMSLGALSFGYNGLRNDQKKGIEDKKSVAQHFNIHHKRLGDWLHKLTYIRNICAHHSRLWNRELAIRPDTMKDSHWLPPITPRNDRIFYILLMLHHLLSVTDNEVDWSASIKKLLEQVSANKHWSNAMGLPEHWREHPLW